jgi:RNA polymerase sigma-70 factor (ECF subfamily)
MASSQAQVATATTGLFLNSAVDSGDRLLERSVVRVAPTNDLSVGNERGRETGQRVMSQDVDRNLDFNALVAKYEKRIFNIIYRMLGDYEEATDLTQETFISAFKHYDRFRGEAKVFTWLYQIARNLCINRVRQRDRQRALHIESLDQPRDPDDDDSLTREVADWRNAPHAVLEEKELRQRILKAIESLPPDYKEVVVLREFQGMSYNEMVEATGLTLENVKTRLSRARGMLRRKLEAYYRM